MNALTQVITQQLAGGASRTIAQRLGVSVGAVGRTQQQEGLDPSGLSNLLNNQQQQAQRNAPGAMGILNSILDQNNDGSAMDDLQRMAAGFFK